MEKIIVRGGRKLQGEVDISVAKNAVLPIIVATILNPTEIVLKKVPMLEDVTVLINLLRELNCEVKFSPITGDLKINTLELKEIEANNELIRKMRASFLVMGPMLARFGRCKISMPGGCNIGSRPVDLHLKGFKALGIDSEIGYGYVEAKINKLHGNRIYLDFPSVGATENIMMTSVFAPGVTVIENAAEEPEIWEHASIIPNMETAIVQACRSVEGILGEPPNSKKQTAVFKHKEKWIELTGINPDSIFEKAGISYLDFYYELFFDMRNPSAHSYGNIHYELEKTKTVQAQCFAAIVVRDYFNKHVLNLDEAQKKLRFNLDLLNRVNEDMSTKLTK